MAKEITFSIKAREKVMAGIDKLANAVRITLGPKGKTVIFREGSPIFSLDGVTVASHIKLENELEQMACELVQDVARKTDKEAGDGTTTAIMLVQTILKEGLKAIAAGIDTIGLKKGIAEGLKIAIETIKKLAKPISIKDKEEMANIGTISSRDPEIGNLVADIINKVGEDAIIAVEESHIVGLHKEIVGGLQFEKGFISPYMMTHPGRGEAILDKPYILITSQALRTNNEIIKLLEKLSTTDNKTLMVIADDVSGDALATFIINKMRGLLRIASAKAPGFGDDKQARLEDIAILTGATFIAEELGTKVEDAELKDLGRADKVILTKENTIIIGGKGKKSEIKKRIKHLKGTHKTTKSEYYKELINSRIAKLQGGVAIIKVGTISPQENKEKRYRIEDAVRSTKSAIKEGIVIGGGMCLWKCAEEIEKRLEKEKDISFRMGLDILAQAIKEPAQQIIRNTGERPDVILERVRTNPKITGYDSARGEYVNLVKEGIIDPAKVVRVALENAVSVVSLFLITEAIISEKDEGNKGKKEGT